MPIKINDIANLVGGKIIGNADLEITNIAKIGEATKGDLTFLYMASYEKFLETTEASAVLIKPSINKINPDITYIEVDAPEKSLLQVILTYFNPEFKLQDIDKTAYVPSSAQLGKNVAIGKNVVIGENCVIADNTKIFHNTVLSNNVTIGTNCLIHANVTLREDSVIGNNVIIHSGTVVGSDGFGYYPDQKGVYTKIPQIGNVIIENDVELGSNVSVDRAALGSTIIKSGTKIDNLVQIAHNVAIGSNTAISAQTGISGSTTVGDHCIMGGQVGLAGHLDVCDKVMIGAQSGISKSITSPGKYFGSPAKDMGVALRLEGHVRNLPDYAKKIKTLEKELKELKDKLEG